MGARSADADLMWILLGLTTALIYLRRRTGVLPILVVTAAVVAITQTILVSALPVFARDLGVTAGDATWLLTAFMPAAAVATPVAGRLGDLFGYRPVLIGALAALTVGTLLAALATEANAFAGVVAARAVQGLGGRAFPVLFGIARTALRPEQQRRAVAAAALAGAIALPQSVRPTRQQRLDLLGAALLGLALVAALLAISQGNSWGWSSARVWALLLLAVGLAVTFVRVELRVEAPLVDVRLLSQRAMATTNLSTLVVSMAMFAAVALIPQFIQAPRSTGYGFAASATETGLAMAPMAVAMLVAGPFAARVRGRIAVQLGAACAAGAYAVLAIAHADLWQLYIAGAILGFGYGLAFAGLGNLVVDGVRAADTGAATGINTILRTVGGAIGAQLSAVIVTGWGDVRTAVDGFVAAFVAAGILALVAVLLAGAIPGKPQLRGRADRDCLPAPGLGGDQLRCRRRRYGTE